MSYPNPLALPIEFDLENDVCTKIRWLRAYAINNLVADLI